MTSSDHQPRAPEEAGEGTREAKQPPPTNSTEALDLEGLRLSGWSVAVHNDYRLNGEPHTFWLFTHPNGRWIKGEGRTDADAVAVAYEQALKTEDAEALASTLREENERLRDARHSAVCAGYAAWPDAEDIPDDPESIIANLAAERDAAREENARLREGLESAIITMNAAARATGSIALTYEVGAARQALTTPSKDQDQ